MFPKGIGCEIDLSSYEVPAIFKVMQQRASLSTEEMYNTFNMGVGMSITVPKEQADRALAVLRESGENAYLIGEIVRGEEKVVIC